MHITDARTLSRRSFMEAIGISAAAPFTSRGLFAEETGIVPTMVKAAAGARIDIHPLRRNISILEGSGGNIAVLTGQDGKLLIDAGFAVSRARILAALDSINSSPIRTLINTHWHVDHTDGNAWLHAAGATITAHANTRKHLSVATRVEGWHYTFPAAPGGAIPAKMFDQKHTIHVNNTGVLLKHYTPAHTDSDISVHFVEADILHVGDTWWNGFYPFIDYSTGGGIDGMIRAAEDNLAIVTDKTIIIPGHGQVGDKSQLAEYRDMLVSIRENVAALKRRGRSLEQTVAAKPTAAYDAKWGQFLMTPAIFTGLVFSGV
jgi:glyoxylase-like metal-dependent hydrolase (beta-lactamase superfamily II)